jgi:transglutaminase-like putative cysteine protease
MKLLQTILLVFAITVLPAALAIYLYTLPGTRRLPKQRRVSLEGITSIEDAVAACRRSGLEGWELVAYAQNLAARKFSYSRRNPWDSPGKAFERGMGYCQQQALALKMVYDRLGIRSQPVYALKCSFPPKVVHGTPEPGGVSPHTWLEVTLGGESKYVCQGDANNHPGILHFEILSEVRPLARWMQPVSHLGSVVENARRDRKALLPS